LQRISLNDYLSSKSSWPRRLLGWEHFALERTETNVEAEYNQDRYTPLLALTSGRMEDYKVQEFANLGMERDSPMFVSFGDEIFSTSLRLARKHWCALIQSTVERFATGRICELGCGYGFNLSILGKGAYGGEHSPAAVSLGHRLGMEVTRFNYYNSEDYSFIQPDSTILTVHSIEQIPSAEPFLQNLARYKDRIREVIHIEPSWLDERSTFTGLIRNRYNELIDHNHDLVKLLRQSQEIEMLHFESEVFGFHPLNSSHVTVWRFKP